MYHRNWSVCDSFSSRWKKSGWALVEDSISVEPATATNNELDAGSFEVFSSACAAPVSSEHIVKELGRKNLQQKAVSHVGRSSLSGDYAGLRRSHLNVWSMAEAIAAAGLASSVVTFLEFGIKLAKLTKQVHDAQGELPKDLQKCQSTVDEFSEWIRNLQTRQSKNGAPSSDADEALKKAIDYCVTDCEDLLRILQDLLPGSVPASGKQGRASNFKTALRAMRQDGRIKKAQKNLETHKNELRLCIAERTMSMVEEARETGSTQLCISRNIEKLQKDGQRRSRETGEEIMELQQQHQTETRQMYTSLTQLQVAGQKETREIRSSLVQLHLARQEEIIACIAQHNLRFDQLHGSLGLVEYDLDTIKMKSDDTLLLVKQLANAIDQRTDGSAVICIRVPAALYEPGLSMWKGFRAYTEKAKQMAMPGGWTPKEWDQLQDRQLGSFSGQDARATYIAVSPSPAEFECLSWKRNLVGPASSMQDFKAAYDNNQSWLSYLLCYEMVAIRPVPLLRDSKAKGDEASNTYRTWREIINRLKITDEKSHTVADETRDEGSAKLESISKSPTLQFEDTDGHSQLESDSPAEDSPVEPQIGIRRRESIPTNLTVEESNLDEWIKSIEDEYRQSTGRLEPFIRINQQLQNMSTVPEDSDAVGRNIHKMLEHFEQRASFEMPELVQMMTTSVDDEVDRVGRFKWGFQLVVARNDANLQLLVFCLAMLIIWIYDPISSRPVQSIASLLYLVLCASPSKVSRPFLHLFGLRVMASSAAVKCWMSYYGLIVFLARRFAAPNPAWEDTIKIKVVASLQRS
ncbi:hypothetical protein FGG08_007340 [Glutinoglossum americanum]|uniref:Fungal N-terminal domain-containing protein n=1 Tax=Glutinoglossum americanum TaxID=1670608 RepID=A0A9P8HR00_9PEZI|nr:hypothetical protein FGG08_007340 [Glutinoglossum americanum]